MVTHASGRHPIDAPGTDERTWTAWPWLSTLPGAGPIGLAGIRSAVIVAAHPDDEVLGAGGLISMLAASRARLRLVAVTDGERSHRGHASPAPLARRRTAETEAALRALGARGAEVIRLKLPDGGLDGRPDELAAALAPLVAGFDLCLAPWDQALRVPLAPRTVSRKRAAITCFGSQTEDRGHGLGPVLTPGMIAHFTRTVEVLLP